MSHLRCSIGGWLCGQGAGSVPPEVKCLRCANARTPHRRECRECRTRWPDRSPWEGLL